MEMKAPSTTAQPQPPSGGVYTSGAGGMSAHDEEDQGKNKPAQVHRDQDFKPVGETELVKINIEVIYM